MYRKLLTVTTPLLEKGNRLLIDFEDEVMPVEVIKVMKDEDGEAEAIGVMADPDSEDAFYGELYLEDYGHWTVVVRDD